jgi:hypothetical protein
MQNPTPVTAHSSAIVKVIILFMEHSNMQYFSEEREQILPFLVQFPEQNSTSILLNKKNKAKSKNTLANKMSKGGLWMSLNIFIFNFPFHLSFV